MNLDIGTKNGYDIATALRGPDSDDLEIFKEAFTAPLRALVGANIDHGIQGWSFWLDAQSAAMKMRSLREDPVPIAALAHWEGHTQRGYRALATVQPNLSEVCEQMVNALSVSHTSVGTMQLRFGNTAAWLDAHGWLDYVRSEQMVMRGRV